MNTNSILFTHPNVIVDFHSLGLLTCESSDPSFASANNFHDVVTVVIKYEPDIKSPQYFQVIITSLIAFYPIYIMLLVEKLEE